MMSVPLGVYVISVPLGVCVTVLMTLSTGRCDSCADNNHLAEGTTSNLELSNMTATNETCHYEIIAPVGQQVEILFDVIFHNQFRCTPASKPTSGIFISYAENDLDTYYDVLCDNKSSYLVRSVGRKLFVKLVINDNAFLYRGIYHYVDPTHCVLFECLNGGSCIVTNGHRFCVCPPGLSGRTCSRCENVTCYNGGSCISSSNTEPYCVCAINFEGRFCERNKNPCLSNPCMFGSCEILTSRDVVEPSDTDMDAYDRMMVDGIVSSSTQKFHEESKERKGRSWRCTCYPGYTGVKCDHNINECSSNPCSQGQECIDGVNDFRCTCGSCVFGLCVLEADGIHCRCFPGFAGTNCTRNINECEGSPCVHGDCVDFINGYVCTCYENYKGRTCNISRNENVERRNGTDMCTRSRNTCENGLCVERESVAVCECYVGFTGKRCNIPTTFLSSKNTTILSQHHRCFGRTDLIEVCQCVASVCVVNETEFRNTTVCKTLPFLLSIERFCSAENVSSLCVSTLDFNAIPMVRLICDREQKMIQLPPNADHVTSPVPIHEKTHTHYFQIYILRCTFQNTKNTVDIELRDDDTALVTALPLFLHPPCYINDNANLSLSNCSLTKLSLLFNLTRIPDYFQSVFFETIVLHDSQSETSNIWSKSNTHTRTISVLLKMAFLSFDNNTQLLEADSVGQATYTCDWRCNDSICKQKICESKSVYQTVEYESRTDNSGDNRSIFCLCPIGGTENMCNETHGDDGNRETTTTSRTVIYLLIAVAILVTLLIPGSAYLCFKRSKQRGHAEFPRLLYIPKTFSHNSTTEEIRNTKLIRSPKLVNARDIFMTNKKKLFQVEGVETGKSEA